MMFYHRGCAVVFGGVKLWYLPREKYAKTRLECFLILPKERE